MKLQAIAPNQTVLELVNGNQVFFSYNTPVAAYISGLGYVITDKHYSNATTRHINKWLSDFGFEIVSQEYLDSLAI